MPVTLATLAPTIIPMITGAAGAGAAGAGAAGAGAIGNIGTLIGAGGGTILSGIESGIEMFKANKAKKAANNLIPDLYDPNQLAMLSELNQLRKSYNSGSAFSNDMSSIDANTAATQEQIARATSGDIGATISGLLMSQNAANVGKNAVLAQGNAQRKYYNTFASDLQNKIAQRSLELQLAQMSQKRAEWAQNSQDAFGNMANAAARTNPQDINWADIFSRHGNTAESPALNPEQQARLLEPKLSIIHPTDVPDVDLSTNLSFLKPR